jgi:hypothetical protein
MAVTAFFLLWLTSVNRGSLHTDGYVEGCIYDELYDPQGLVLNSVKRALLSFT